MKSQEFVNGIDLKEDLKRLHELYSQLPPEERKRGLYKFAPHPPDDDTFLTTRLWNKYLPYWKAKDNQPVKLDPELEKAYVILQGSVFHVALSQLEDQQLLVTR